MSGPAGAPKRKEPALPGAARAGAAAAYRAAALVPTCLLALAAGVYGMAGASWAAGLLFAALAYYAPASVAAAVVGAVVARLLAGVARRDSALVLCLEGALLGAGLALFVMAPLSVIMPLVAQGVFWPAAFAAFLAAVFSALAGVAAALAVIRLARA